ncbi:type II toxin-antitoxin system HicA family toxin [Sphaerospermopsis sp. LEGE 00249]
MTLVEAFGFSLSRINASHHIFTHPTIPELINLQNRKLKLKDLQKKF